MVVHNTNSSVFSKTFQMKGLSVGLGLWLAVLAGDAHATKPTLRLERIDPARFAADGRVRVFASVVELEGQVDDGKVAQSFTLRVDGKGAQHPSTVEPFRTSAVPLDLVLVIETSALYGVQKLPAPAPGVAPTPSPGSRKKGKKAPAPPKTGTPSPPHLSGELPLDRVKDALATLVEGRPAKTRVLVIDYGGEVTPHPPFQPANAAGGALDELAADGESGDLHLVDAVQAALVELNRPRPSDGDEAPPRRLVVVVSDGLNAQMDRKTFRALGDAAAISQVPIHSIAYSPADDRGPLLNLGEISKRSNGTFRWARNAEELKAQIETLADELDKQYVLTFELAIDTLAGHTFELRCEDLRSNSLRYGEGGSIFGYTGVITRRSTLRLVLEIVGGVIAALLALAVIVTLLRRRVPRGEETAQAAMPRLVWEGETRELPLDPRMPLLFGKERGAVQLTDPAVSTRHARLAFDGRSWVLTDLGSTNGTLVDGHRIDRPTVVTVGSVVQLGQTRLRLMGPK